MKERIRGFLRVPVLILLGIFVTSFWLVACGVAFGANIVEDVTNITTAGQPSVLIIRDEDGNFRIVNGTAQGAIQVTSETAVLHYTTAIHADNLGADAYRLLIDLDNGVGNFPHATGGSNVDVDWIHFDADQNSAFRGDFFIGWVTAVGANSGTLQEAWVVHSDLAGSHIESHSQFSPQPIAMNFNETFVSNSSHAVLNSTTGIIGPDGGYYIVEEGDVVLFVDRSAGNTDVTVTIGYHLD